jgi:hypothetical protein
MLYKTTLVRYDVLTQMLMKSKWDMMLVNNHQNFGEALCLILQGICHQKKSSCATKNGYIMQASMFGAVRQWQWWCLSSWWATGERNRNVMVSYWYGKVMELG